MVTSELWGPFLSACHGQYRQIFATALFTGMREGELFGLRKQDVDWSSGEITVRKSWDGDTTKSRRELVIPIARDLSPYLRAAVDSSDSVLVFPRPDGTMHSRNLHVNERIRTALKAAGIIVGYDHKCRRCGFKVRRTSSAVTKCPECGFALWVSPVPKDISIHKLRHTTGTLLSKAGVPIQIIQKVFGGPLPPPRHARHAEGARRAPALRGASGAINERASHVSGTEARIREDEGRDPPVSRAKSRPSKSGRQDLNLRPLGPEGSPPGSDTVGSDPTATDVPEIIGDGSGERSDTDRPSRPRPALSVTFQAQRTLGTSRFLTVREVADRLRVSRATVYRLVAEGRISAVRISCGAIRVHPSGLPSGGK
jgi:excisionase family DNA binding protein